MQEAVITKDGFVTNQIIINFVNSFISLCSFLMFLKWKSLLALIFLNKKINQSEILDESRSIRLIPRAFKQKDLINNLECCCCLLKKFFSNKIYYL